MIYRILIIFSFFCHCFIIAFSQQKWTLETCIDYAVKNNLQIKQQELNKQYSKNTLLQSKAGILPTLNGYSTQQYNFGRSVDPFTNDFTENNVRSNNFSVSSSLTLFNGLQNYNTIQRNKFNLLASQYDIDKTINDISLKIASAYLQILFNQEMLGIAKTQLEITKQQAERTAKLVEAGSLPHGNLLEIEAQLASEELQAVNAENQSALSYLTLIQLIEFDSAAGFDIIKPVLPEINEQSLNITVEQAYQEALKNLPQIKSAEYKLKSAEKGLSVAEGSRSPRLSMSANWGTGFSSAIENYKITDTVFSSILAGYTQSGEDVYNYNFDVEYETETRPFEDQINDNLSTTLTFSLSIPIFNGLQTYSSVSNAKINVLNQQYQLQSVKNQLYREIQQAHADAFSALKKYVASKKAVSSMDEAFRYSEQKFNLGLMNQIDYNIAKNQLTKASSDLLQAKYEYIFKSKILEFYMGNPIKL
ncbi:MAG: TolC family protein [Bacteroidia bacterium]|nr:TolC family protein [Bacteroidia bacterium]